MDFVTGEIVIMNTENSPATHMKKGIVLNAFVERAEDGRQKILVSVDQGDQGHKGYLVFSDQLLHIQREPAFDNFMKLIIPIQTEIETAEEQKDREEDELVRKINDEKKLHNVAFNEGYEKGWQDAILHIKNVMDKRGY